MQQQNRMDLDTHCQWLQLQADDYSAWVSLHTLRKHPESLLAGLADTVLSHGSDRLRLDMSPDVAQEVVSVLRLGEGYVPPTDHRLVAALQHQLDYLGLPAPPRLPARLPINNPYLFVHSYSCELVDEEGRDMGMLLYSSQGGWSSMDKESGDPRPANMDPAWYYAATTLPADATGAGQDLMLVAGPERCSSYLMEADTRVVHRVPSCKGPTGPCVAVGGKAYLLGRHGAAAVSCFDPYVSCWFTATAMPGGMYDFAAVSPPSSSVVLTFGGVDSGTGRHRNGIDMYDSRTRSWVASPSGACLPRASRGLAAAALDDHRVLVFGGSGGRAANILELRTWRLLPAGQLSSERQHMAGVAFGNTVLSLGGVNEHEEYVDVMEAYDASTGQWSVVGRMPCPMSHMAVTAANVSTSGLTQKISKRPSSTGTPTTAAAAAATSSM